MTRAVRIMASLVLMLSISPSAATAQVQVLLIGDSYTEGTVTFPLPGSKDVAGCPSSECYAAKLSASLGAGYSVTNIGVGGAASGDWRPGILGLPRFDAGGGVSIPLFDHWAEPELSTHVVVILLGANDATGFFEAAPATGLQYLFNLRLIIAGLAYRSSWIILLQPAQLYSQSTTIQDRITEYGGWVEFACAEAPNVICGPDLKAVLNVSDFPQGSVHPSPDGHTKIADAVEAAILALPPPVSRPLIGGSITGGNF